MELYINAFAHYLPDNRVPNSYFKDVNGLDDEWIRTRTGISTRSKAGENENTNTMALEAVKRLNEKLPFPIEEVDLIVAATYSPHDTVATAAHMIQRHLRHEPHTVSPFRQPVPRLSTPWKSLRDILP